MMEMLESKIEKRLVDMVKKENGICIKLTGYKGIPDRMILKQGKVVFIELKQKGKRLRVEQEMWKRKLESHGFEHYVVDDYESVDDVKKKIN